MTPDARTRLTRDDWLDAGLRALCRKGPDALRAEPLARGIGVTKGSFYWHFTDLAAYHTALLARWEAHSLAAMQAVTEAAGSETLRLRRLCQSISNAASAVGGDDTGAAAAEPAIRAWSPGSAAARDSVARVDASRLAQLQHLLSALGIRNPEMARILLAAATGMAAIAPPANGSDNAEAVGSLVDLVLALR